MATEYVNKLKSFSKNISGEFHHAGQQTKTMKRLGWSRVEIELPIPGRTARFIAFSGTNQAEVFSGFYANSSLSKKLVCTITQKDKVLSLLHSFNKLKVKSGRPSTDKKLSIISNDKMFVHRLTGNPEVARFLESTLKLPMRFEIISNFNGYINELDAGEQLISINTNEWIVDEKKLMSMYEGFRMILDQVR